MFKYWGFGLHIISAIEFPELLPADFSEADVTISLGQVPGNIKGEVLKKRAISVIGKDEYLLAIKNICKYYVSHGNSIVAEPLQGIDIASVRLFLLGTVMAAVLYQRGSIPLHASAVVKDGSLLVFAGNSGAGKSTLLAHLAGSGLSVFTDDICVLSQGSAGVCGTASYPMIKLWDDAIAGLGEAKFNRDFKVRPQLPKYGQFFSEDFITNAVPVGKIYVLSTSNAVQQVTVKKLSPLQAFKQLETQAYKYQLILNVGLKGVHFSLLSALTAAVPVYEVKRPLSDTTVEQLSETLSQFI